MPPFPPYTHVPGRTPHPIGDPAGHSYGKRVPPCPAPDLETGESCWAVVEGRRLFDAGYYWEAHETWEIAWMAAGRRGAIADLLKGLIKLAAAGVKLYEGQPAGVERHARRAEALFEGARRELGDQALGFSLPELAALAAAIAAAPPRLPAVVPGTAVPLFSLPAATRSL